MRHAYLIIAHNEIDVLKRLLMALDDDRNDIFIHWDAKMSEVPVISLNHSRLFLTNNRVDVRWGDYSVVEAEFELFETASSHGYYDYYHLLSGVDMPLVGQDEIHSFFMKNRGKEFIGFSNYPGLQQEVDRKMRWHLFPKHFQRVFKLTPVSVTRSLVLRIQSVLGIRKGKNCDLKKGTQWISVTDAFIRYMIQEKPRVRKLFTHTFCPDEIFAQTLCWNSSFKDCIFDVENEGHGCMRAIGWRNGILLPWTMDDYKELKSSGMLFARKFSSDNMDVVELILNDVKG